MRATWWLECMALPCGLVSKFWAMRLSENLTNRKLNVCIHVLFVWVMITSVNSTRSTAQGGSIRQSASLWGRKWPTYVTIWVRRNMCVAVRLFAQAHIRVAHESIALHKQTISVCSRGVGGMKRCMQLNARCSSDLHGISRHYACMGVSSWQCWRWRILLHGAPLVKAPNYLWLTWVVVTNH